MLFRSMMSFLIWLFLFEFDFVANYVIELYSFFSSTNFIIPPYFLIVKYLLQEIWFLTAVFFVKSRYKSLTKLYAVKTIKYNIVLSATYNDQLATKIHISCSDLKFKSTVIQILCCLLRFHGRESIQRDIREEI
jgi:hypothetical protein